jgi:D-sedoheptulose 7-phosphate isomerase
MHQPMPSDILIAISGSGNSKNVLNAVQHFHNMHAKVISFTGFDGGKLKKITSHNIHFPYDDMCMTEAYHSLVMHYIVEKIKHLRIQAKNA